MTSEPPASSVIEISRSIESSAEALVAPSARAKRIAKEKVDVLACMSVLLVWIIEVLLLRADRGTVAFNNEAGQYRLTKRRNSSQRGPGPFGSPVISAARFSGSALSSARA